MNKNKLKYLFDWAKARENKDENFIPHHSLTLMKNKYILVQHVEEEEPILGTILILSDRDQKRTRFPEFKNERNSISGQYLWCELALYDEKKVFMHEK